MRKDVLLIAHFTSDFDEKGNNRFNYLASLFIKNGFDVELVTSDFSHSKKTRRNTKPNSTGYRITFISEPGYTENVSLSRFYSHYVFGNNLEKYLDNRHKPDIIYCAVPTLDAATVAAKYSKRSNIKFIIDVQDLWPEAFQMVFHTPLISNMIYYPMKRQANYIYKSADAVVSVSDTYLDRVLRVNTSSKDSKSIYLGTEINLFDKLAEGKLLHEKPKEEIWIAYIGTLGHSYDLSTVLDALSIIKDIGVYNVKFLVMGDGPLRNSFESYAREKQLAVKFTGRLDYGSMVRMLKSCDIAVNPIRARSAGSIINKVADYAAAGLPILNTQNCIEYRNLLDEYQAGLNCKSEDAEDLAAKMNLLIENPVLRKQMGNNSRTLAQEKFDRNITYMEIVNLLDKLN